MADTWAIVVATALGPVLAVIVSMWREERISRYNRRLSTFRSLMATRRNGISSEHVYAINVIEVDFYNISSVQAKWKSYKGHLNTDPKNDPNWGETKERLLAELLFEMGQSLKLDIDALEIFKGGYAPRAWESRETKQAKVLDFAEKIASGERELPITVKTDAKDL